MRRPFLAVALSLSLVVLGGCADGSPGMVITGVAAPTDACVFSETEDTLLVFGTLDVSVGNPYTAVLRVNNQLTNLLGSTAGPGAPSSNPTDITVERAIIRILDATTFDPVLPAGSNLIAATGFIISSDGMTPGVGLVTVDLVPIGALGDLTGLAGSGAQILVEVTLLGTTSGGDRVESPVFTYRIDLCAGCLDLGEATNPMDEPVCLLPCFPGQDALFTTHPPGVCEGA